MQGAEWHMPPAVSICVGDGSSNSISDSKLVSPFEHSALQHVAAIPGGHPGPEAVDAHAPSLSGLISSFWHYLLPQISTNYSDSQKSVSIRFLSQAIWPEVLLWTARTTQRQISPDSIPSAPIIDTKLPITMALIPLPNIRNCVNILAHRRFRYPTVGSNRQYQTQPADECNIYEEAI